MKVPEGMFVYLCSGEVIPFPMASSLSLDADTVQILSGLELIGSIPRKLVWFASKIDVSPVPS